MGIFMMMLKMGFEHGRLLYVPPLQNSDCFEVFGDADWLNSLLDGTREI